ncbi:response regulator [Agrobacterium larrymoorei]|nr:response regulator [Agrobacterium larrymoorei]
MLDAVCEAISAALFIYDRDDHIVFASRRILSFFQIDEALLRPGMRLRDFLGAVFDVRKADDNAPVRETEREEWIAEHLAAHWKERAEQVDQRPGDKWLRYTKRRFPSGLGICVISDISEQKKREDQWRYDIERVQITEEILDTLPLSIFVKDRNRVYAAVNKSGCSLLETSPDLILGRTVFDIHSNPLAARIDEMDVHVLETGVPAILPERVTRLTGEELLVVTRKQRVGKPGRYFLVTTMDDVTAFAVAGEDGKSYIPGLEHLAFVSSSYMDDEHHQASLVLKGRSVLLVTSSVRNGELACKKLCAVGVDCAVVSTAAEQKAFMEFAAKAGVRIDLVIVDVQMELGCLDVPQAYGVDVMTVDDFQLGSSLVNLATRHFRSVSTLQKGCADANDDWTIAHDQTASANRRGLDVLVVEDNKINQIVFRQIMESLGLNYRVAANAQEALQYHAAQNPAIIVLDTTLPDLDGFEVARRIRAMEPPSQPRTPIIGVVALAFEGDRKACLDAGMDEMLLKPISPDMIETLFKRFLPKLGHRLQG